MLRQSQTKPQADSESHQTVMGSQTELRLTGAGQHSSNSLVEGAVQSVRRLANCLRMFGEERARLSITGDNHLFAWSFKYASFLINRYRALEGVGGVSYELVLYGEVVMYKGMIRRKGSNALEQGTWCGKHSFIVT